MAHIIHRRRALAVAAAAMASRGASAIAQGATGFSAIQVDVSRLAARGLGGYADAVRAALQAELTRAFADRMARGGARLVVRVDAVSMRDYVGGDGRLFGSGGATNSDYMEGEALVLGPRGEILARRPQLSALPASSGGAWYDPDSERRRLIALAAHFAGWLRRSI